MKFSLKRKKFIGFTLVAYTLILLGFFSIRDRQPYTDSTKMSLSSERVLYLPNEAGMKNIVLCIIESFQNETLPGSNLVHIPEAYLGWMDSNLILKKVSVQIGDISKKNLSNRIWFPREARKFFLIKEIGVDFNRKCRDPLFKVFSSQEKYFKRMGVGLTVVHKIIGCIRSYGAEFSNRSAFFISFNLVC